MLVQFNNSWWLYQQLFLQKGLVLGVYYEEGKNFKLTPAAEHYNTISKGKLVEYINL